MGSDLRQIASFCKVRRREAEKAGSLMRGSVYWHALLYLCFSGFAALHLLRVAVSMLLLFGLEYLYHC